MVEIKKKKKLKNEYPKKLTLFKVCVLFYKNDKILKVISGVFPNFIWLLDSKFKWKFWMGFQGWMAMNFHLERERERERNNVLLNKQFRHT
jgi:hypothetical protein